MTASMTAFTRTESSDGKLIWEVRSVNHRYLDIHLKLPEEIRALEPSCRELISKHLTRGRIDAQLRLEQNVVTNNQTYAINHRAVDSVSGIIKQIEAYFSDLQPARITDILNWPGVILKKKQDSSTLSQNALALLNEALNSLGENRKCEGNKLEQLIVGRVELCRTLLESLMDEIGDIMVLVKRKWQERIEEFCQEFDNTRLNQEIAILLIKSDIHEEIERLQVHLDEVNRVVSTGKPSGRRLDFLMQELKREANTLGSKSVDIRMTNASVELKVLIDQMREQVQNIE